MNISKLDIFNYVKNNDVSKITTYLDGLDVETSTHQLQVILEMAVTQAKLNIVKALLKRGGNPNHQDNDGWSIVHRAGYLLTKSDVNRMEIWSELVNSGGDIGLHHSKGATPLDMIRDTSLRQQLADTSTKHATLQTAVSEKQTTILPKKKMFILFPGQGVQEIGMMPNLLTTNYAKDLFDKANNILGYDLFDLIKNGPDSKLQDTYYSQPVVFVCSLIAFHDMREKHPEYMTDYHHYYAGFSLGEYTALVASGKMSFEDGLVLVQNRAKYMQGAANKMSGGMTTIVGLDDTTLEKMCSDWAANNKEDKHELGVLQIANYLFPKCRVLSGSIEGIEWVENKAKQLGALKITRTKVSGSFHTSMMSSAQAKLEQDLEKVKWDVTDGELYSNVTGQIYENYSKNTMIENLSKQLVSSVQFEKTLQDISLNFGEETNDMIVELGPKRTLQTMMRRVGIRAFKKMQYFG